MAGQTEQYEVRESQVQNLLTYIQQLESSNQEMIHKIDMKHFNEAQHYKDKVLDLLQATTLSKDKREPTYTSS